jgi:D-sedoheptulose 7-phosphate isomerase
MTDRDRDLACRTIAESVAAKEALAADEVLLDQLMIVVDAIEKALRAGGKIVLFGNGGSAADAMHLAAEFLGRFSMDREALPAISLSDNVSAVTAIGNDFGYAQVFERQAFALAQGDDVFIGLSTSGQSENVARGLAVGRSAGAYCVAFTGQAGGACGAEADICLRMPSGNTARIQECYMLLCHTLCELVERRLVAAAAVGIAGG